VNGWHEAYNDMPGPDVVCGHLALIADPPASADPPDACGDCLAEGSTWVELRRCLVCGRVSCCDSSPRRHATSHYERTGHPVIASHSGAQDWGWCFVDGMPLTPGDD
jgi:monovalent cation/hydrogen antiporter